MGETINDKPELSRSAINETLGQTALTIHEFSASQSELWRQLPYLALQVEGNGGYNGFNQTLYKSGLLGLRIGRETSGFYGIKIDCESGNILDVRRKHNFDQPASDEDVLAAWLVDDGIQFNAQTWLDNYRQRAVQPHAEYSSVGEVDVRQWRHETAQRLGLTSMYSRQLIAS